MNGMLEGKAVAVTGAGRGLGEAFATHAAQAGALVVVNDIEEGLAKQVADTINTYGGTAVVSAGDIADPDQAAAIVERCVQEFGRIDGLVNNAGLNYDTPSWRDEPDRIRELISVNVLGSMYTGTAALRAMAEAGCGGSIVNISSAASFGQRNLATYAASKGALASLTYSWALDCEEIGVRVNAVCPVAHTRMVWNSERALRGAPPSRTPAKIAPVVLYLLSDEADGITGQMVRCNGNQLHIIGQPYMKQPVLEREIWDSESVRRAFDGVLAAHLEPYGLEKRRAPRERELFATLESVS
ncbi:SDR family NAD(P)-dependent oxidoreductase [Sciscionella sediminilitoris]|uniref:SDR family NAD(P)-dependent oxidoreductase n=1 Tax=Sciscionella sediminilitoris TaxID=1445613 RepID=UPI0004DF1897|nr:SDR family oxidoreductase [Sciscionella sp. SE31]